VDKKKEKVETEGNSFIYENQSSVTARIQGLKRRMYKVAKKAEQKRKWQDMIKGRNPSQIEINSRSFIQ
jgi:hypothetical protein